MKSFPDQIPYPRIGWPTDAGSLPATASWLAVSPGIRCVAHVCLFFFRGPFDGGMLLVQGKSECMMRKQLKVMAGAVNFSMQEEVEATAKMEQICLAVS